MNKTRLEVSQYVKECWHYSEKSNGLLTDDEVSLIALTLNFTLWRIKKCLKELFHQVRKSFNWRK